MVENIHRQPRARRHGTEYSIREVIAEAAAEVDRPVVYAVAIIVAGFLPIYVLSGPSGRLFRPMADTTIFALIGALVLTLTRRSGAVRPVAPRRRRERRNAVFEAMRDGVCPGPRLVLARIRAPRCWRRSALFAASLAAHRAASAPSSCPISTKARSGSGPPCPRTISLEESSQAGSAVPPHSQQLSRGHRGRLRARPPRRRHQSDRILQRRVLRRAQAVQRVARRLSQQGRADRRP